MVWRVSTGSMLLEGGPIQCQEHELRLESRREQNRDHAAGLGRSRPKKRLSLHCLLAGRMGSPIIPCIWQRRLQVFSYIREMLRVLRPGGALLFQFKGSHRPTMNLRGRLAWGMVDVLWSAHLWFLSRKTASLLGLDPAAADKSWRRAAISASRISALVQANGGEVREMPGEGTPVAWCCGAKKVLA